MSFSFQTTTSVGECFTSTYATESTTNIGGWLQEWSLDLSPNTKCNHLSIYNFMIQYTPVSPDTTSSYIFTYYAMGFNGLYKCVK